MKMKWRKAGRFEPVLLLSCLLAAFLNTYKIWENETANAYYTAAVTSMLQSWHNFFFASLDPAGFISIDKPPAAFWVQSVFAYIFGVHGWSVILPQALAGVGSVLLIYYLVKPSFGKTAARWSSLIMACTPIAVAVSRTNNIDSLLVFTLLLAAGALFKGAKKKSLAWTIIAFGLVGIGFNMKMFQAYMVVPAFYLFFLLAYKGVWKKKLAALAAATAVLVVVTFSWAAAVDLTPASERPYVGGSKTNSVLELATGYNGLNRLTGMGGRGGGGGPALQSRTAYNIGAPGERYQAADGYTAEISGGVTNSTDSQLRDEQAVYGQAGFVNKSGGTASAGSGAPQGDIQDGPPQGFDPNRRQAPGGGGGAPQGPNPGGGAFGTGQAGPLRLFQKELSGQISWLLPLAFMAGMALLAGWRPKRQLTEGEKEILFWLAWLLPAAVFFSIAGFYHHYYMIMMAPPIAALAGAGWTRMAYDFKYRNGWKAWLLPASLLVTIAFALYIMYPYRGQIGWGWLVGIAGAGAAALLLLLLANNKEKVFSMASVLGMLAMLAGPLYWAATPLIYGDNNVMPQAGPGQRARTQVVQNLGGSIQKQPDALIEYIDNHSSGEKYYLMTSDIGTAESYIISTGKAVVAFGGFSGSDPALTVEKLEEMVRNKEVKFFLIPSGQENRGGSSNNEALNWVRKNSTEVPREYWQSGSLQAGPGGRESGSMTLYQIN